MTKEPDHETLPRSAEESSRFDWSATTWGGHAAAQLARVAAASPAERLAWLEGAIELAVSSGAIVARQASPPSGPETE